MNPQAYANMHNWRAPCPTCVIFLAFLANLHHNGTSASTDFLLPLQKSQINSFCINCGSRLGNLANYTAEVGLTQGLLVGSTCIR